MPVKTRSSAGKKAKRSSVPTQNGSQAVAERSVQLSEATPQTPRNGGELQERVVGSRMSNVKHSGLLARDEALRLLEEEDEEEGGRGLLDLNTPLVGQGLTAGSDTEMEEGEPLQVMGREIYTIQSGKRSAKKPPRIAQRSVEQTTEEKESGEDGEGVIVVGAAGGKVNPTANGVAEKQQRVSRNKQKSIRKDSDGEMDKEPQESGDNTQREVERRKERQTKDVGRSLRKTRARAAQWRSDSDREDSENSEEEEEEEEEEEGEMEAVAAQLNRGCPTDYTLEDYFTAHTEKPGPTSDHTLARLSRPRLERAAIETALKDVSSPFEGDCVKLRDEYTQLYHYWLLQMHSGFNILLYGLGSKKRVLDDFCSSCLSQSCHLVVNGYFPGLSLKQGFSLLTSELLDHSGSFKSLTEHAQFIINGLEKQLGKKKSPKRTPREVFIIIHNLDGPNLRNSKAQTALSLLASSNLIHLIASVDHINSALLWDHTKVGRFNWAWHDVTTFETYREETSYENSLLVQQSGSLALSSLTHVMRSLTPNARGIFELLARHQLEGRGEGERNYQGLSFAECYRRCREKFLVNSDLTLRAQLTEFTDHKLVRTNRGRDGVEYLTIPVDDSTLEQFLNEFTDQ